MQKKTIGLLVFIISMILVPLFFSGCGAEDVKATDRRAVEKSGAFVVGPGYTYDFVPPGLTGTGTATGAAAAAAW